MMSDPSHVVVLPEDSTRAPVHAVCAHHRDIPEVRGEGNSPDAAAARLVEMLAQTLDSAPSEWRRNMIERAIDDVRAFVEHARP